MTKKEMSFWEHFRELRKRLILCVAIFLIMVLISSPLTPFVINFITTDLIKDAPLIVLSPMEAVIVYLNVSILIGFVLSLPVFIYHMWAFLVPGLFEKERKLFLLILISSISLFIIGAAFSYHLLLPMTLRFLIGISYPVALPMLDLRQTINFIVLTLILFGIVFQLPLVTAVLSWLGILNHRVLKSGRSYFIILALILAAIITDPSVLTQILVAIPIIILYEISILTSRILEGK